MSDTSNKAVLRPIRVYEGNIENGMIRMPDAEKKFHQNQIQCKHVDFLLCEPDSLKPLLVIELDDGSHRKYDRQTSDEFKDKTFKNVGLPVKRVMIQTNYSAPQLREQILDMLRQNN